MRRLIAFPCAGEQLVGSLDEAAGKTGLLIVSGGNEVRSGAHRGMALLSHRIARELDVPVFRFDRRGIGDSTGSNGGFESAAEDIAAAAATFRAQTRGMHRLLAFGNCDAASALALYHRSAGIDGLLLANPWVIEDAGDLPPTAAIRARYANRLRDPRQWLRLLSGGVNISSLLKGLSKVLQKSLAEQSGLARRIAAALATSDASLTVLLARRDNTAIVFGEAWNSSSFDQIRSRARMTICDTASHSFARQADQQWLFEQLRQSLKEVA